MKDNNNNQKIRNEIDWINGDFNQNIDSILNQIGNVSIKDAKSIKQQFSCEMSNADKFWWLELLAKENSSGATTKYYYQTIFKEIKSYNQNVTYFNKNRTTIDNLEIGQKYSKKQICLLANSGDVMSGILVSNVNKKDSFITINLDKDYQYKSSNNTYTNTRNQYDPITKQLKYYAFTKSNFTDIQTLDHTKNKNIMFNSLGHNNDSGYIYAFVNATKENLKYIKDLNPQIDQDKDYIYIGKYIFNDVSNNAPYYFTLENADKIIDKKYINQCIMNSQIKSIDIYQKLLSKETNMSQEDKKALVKIRTNQGLFRDLLLKKYNYKCPLSGFSNSNALIASHIKPWAQCKNNQEKIDENNGILLNALADKLFDKGLITFDQQGQIIYSKELIENDINIFKKQLLDNNTNIKQFINKQMLVYLKYHNDNIFLG